MKDYLKAIIGLVLAIGLLVGILVIIRNFNRQASMVLTSDECVPPCWYEIRPGVTNSAQVYAVLDQLYGVNVDNISAEYNKADELVSISWFFQRPVEDSYGSVYFDKDQVAVISILTVNSLKLSDYFEKFGEPEQYWTEVGRGDNREYLDLFLFYPAKGILLEVVLDIQDEGNQMEIRASNPIFRVTYFDPTRFDDLLKTQLLISKPAGARTGSFQPWSGFGVISFERK